MTRPTFEQNLAKGKIAESEIAWWLRRHGWTIIPVYEKEIGSGKGPQVYTPDRELIAPDLWAWKQNKLRFIEVKNKSRFTWFWKEGRWQTGIDQHHYEQYLLVGEHFGFDIWLMFLHEQSQPSASDLAHNCPAFCPVGLFGRTLKILKDRVHHRDSRWAKGMVYWNYEVFGPPLCPLSELRSTTESLAFEHVVLSGQQGKLL